MFTGIVQALGEVSEVTHGAGGRVKGLAITVPPAVTAGLEVGGSCAIDGVCLTLSQQLMEKGQEKLFFDLGSYTQKLTTLGKVRVGDKLHFERSLRFGHEVGGHGVSGHVDGTAALVSVTEAEADDDILTFELPNELGKYLISGGYVALAGCSLTLREVVKKAVNPEKGQTQFSVNLIKETQRQTHFLSLLPGERVNVEVDYQSRVMIDTIEQTIENTMKQLMKKV